MIPKVREYRVTTPGGEKYLTLAPTGTLAKMNVSAYMGIMWFGAHGWKATALRNPRGIEQTTLESYVDTVNG